MLSKVSNTQLAASSQQPGEAGTISICILRKRHQGPERFNHLPKVTGLVQACVIAGPGVQLIGRLGQRPLASHMGLSPKAHEASKNPRLGVRSLGMAGLRSALTGCHPTVLGP